MKRSDPKSRARRANQATWSLSHPDNSIQLGLQARLRPLQQRLACGQYAGTLLVMPARRVRFGLAVISVKNGDIPRL
jgi:hypothetical protein